MSEFMDGDGEEDGEGEGEEEGEREVEQQQVRKKGKRKASRHDEPDFPPLFTTAPIANGERASAFGAIPQADFDVRSLISSFHHLPLPANNTHLLSLATLA